MFPCIESLPDGFDFQIISDSVGKLLKILYGILHGYEAIVVVIVVGIWFFLFNSKVITQERV